MSEPLHITATDSLAQIDVNARDLAQAASGHQAPYVLTVPFALRQPIIPVPPPQLLVTPMSRNYRGSRFSARNYSAAITDHENCAVWVTGLPRECTYSMLLGSIRNTSKVYATHINPATGQHQFCAAKIVFFDRAGVDRLLQQASASQFVVGGLLPNVALNRVKSTGMPDQGGSRVVAVSGPVAVVNVPILTAFFNDYFVYDLEKVETLGEDQETRVQCWSFASFRCQAQTAWSLLRTQRARPSGTTGEERAMWARVRVWYGQDPCSQ